MAETKRWPMPSTLAAGASSATEQLPSAACASPADRRDDASDSAQKPVPHNQRAENKSAMLELAYDEFCCRTEAGEQIDPTEFCRRFPSFQASLCRLLLMHHCLVEPIGEALPISTPCWPKAGQSWLGFELVEELGRGSFARVYLARQPDLGDRWVALKVSPQGEVEAHTLGKLIHPHIVPVHSIQQDPASQLSAVCMPFLGRTTLCDVLDQVLLAPWPPASGGVIAAAIARARPASSPAAAAASGPLHSAGDSYITAVLRIGVALADALEHTHAQGVWHLDLKPSNVLIADDGRPMLLDFNLSLDQRSAGDKIGGTLPYMSPEQLWSTVLGEASVTDTVDHRSDLFSLGVVLYELLTGHTPFGPVPVQLPSRQIAEHLLQRQRAGPLPIAGRKTGVDPALAEWIERCLAYDAAQRPASAGLLRDALKKQLSPLRRARRWMAAHRHRVRAAAVAATLLLAAGIGYVATLPPYPQRLLASAERQSTSGNLDEALRAFDQCLTLDPNWYEARLGRAQVLERQGMFLQAEAEYRRINTGNVGAIAARRAWCLASAGWYEAALRVSDDARGMGQASPELLANMGYCYNKLGNPSQAKQVLDLCLEKAPRMTAALYQRASADLQQGLIDTAHDPAQGLVDIGEVIRQAPRCAEAHRIAARLHVIGCRTVLAHAEPMLMHIEAAMRYGLEMRELPDYATIPSLRNDPRIRHLLNQPVGRYQQSAQIRLVEPPIK